MSLPGAEVLVWGGAELGAGFVLINPLHAAEPSGRMGRADA